LITSTDLTWLAFPEGFLVSCDKIGYKMEPMDIVGKAKEDASLPKATMTKIIKEMLPGEVRVARDAQDLLIECCVVCNREEKRTIAPEHVLKALQPLPTLPREELALMVLGFGEYTEEVYAAYEQHKIETMQDGIRTGKWSNSGAEMTEEEAAAEQQRMFAEARARMNGAEALRNIQIFEETTLYLAFYSYSKKAPRDTMKLKLKDRLLEQVSQYGTDWSNVKKLPLGMGFAWLLSLCKEVTRPSEEGGWTEIVYHETEGRARDDFTEKDRSRANNLPVPLTNWKKVSFFQDLARTVRHHQLVFKRHPQHPQSRRKSALALAGLGLNHMSWARGFGQRWCSAFGSETVAVSAFGGGAIAQGGGVGVLETSSIALASITQLETPSIVLETPSIVLASIPQLETPSIVLGTPSIVLETYSIALTSISQLEIPSIVLGTPSIVLETSSIALASIPQLETPSIVLGTPSIALTSIPQLETPSIVLGTPSIVLCGRRQNRNRDTAEAFIGLLINNTVVGAFIATLH
ncbi:hypothetical protein KSS87_003121, partial [Heliosperma pusillum]